MPDGQVLDFETLMTDPIIKRITLLAGTGHDRGMIAQAIGISLEQLNEEYSDIIESSGIRLKAAMLEKDFALAMEGKSASIKRLMTMSSFGLSLAGPGAAMPGMQGQVVNPHTKTREYIGKRQMDALVAETSHVGTEWEELLQQSEAS